MKNLDLNAYSVQKMSVKKILNVNGAYGWLRDLFGIAIRAKLILMLLSAMQRLVKMAHMMAFQESVRIRMDTSDLLMLSKQSC